MELKKLREKFGAFAIQRESTGEMYFVARNARYISTDGGKTFKKESHGHKGGKNNMADEETKEEKEESEDESESSDEAE